MSIISPKEIHIFYHVLQRTMEYLSSVSILSIKYLCIAWADQRSQLTVARMPIAQWLV